MPSKIIEIQGANLEILQFRTRLDYMICCLLQLRVRGLARRARLSRSFLDIFGAGGDHRHQGCPLEIWGRYGVFYCYFYHVGSLEI